MRLHNYNLNWREVCLSVGTLTGGVLVQRHWCMEGSSKWGHRAVAIIEAIPVLGGLVALIEIAVMKCLFEATPIDEGHYSVIRRKKGEAPPLGGNPANLLPLQGPAEKQNSGGVLDEEGLRVRTFCLELLSNLEDVIKQIPPDQAIKLEECKGVLRYFIENGALEKRAGFSDFLRFIERLRDQVPEIAPILKRFFDLVSWQKHLPKRKELNHWNRIKLAIQVGLFKGIDQISERVEAVGLHSIPAIPKCERIVNLYPMIDAINLVESNHREAARWLMTRVRVFTFRELCQSIQQSCLQLRDPILSWDRYCLLTIKDKSQEWMADLAVRYLPKEKMPGQVLSMDHQEVGMNLLEHLKGSGFDHFILFDDGAYSGRQIDDYLSDLQRSLYYEFQATDVPNVIQFERKKTIYLVFGFFPKDKDLQKEVVERKFEKYNVHIQVLTSCRIESCNTLMENEQLPDSMTEKVRHFAGSGIKPLIATEWKKPDFMSTPMFVTQGWTDQWGRARYGELRKAPSEVLHMDGEGPLANVVPPYRLKSPL